MWWFPIALAAGVIVRALTPHTQLLGEVAWVFFQTSALIFLIGGTMLACGYGFVHGLDRLAARMRAKDKLSQAARSSARRGSAKPRGRRASPPAG